MELTQHHPQVAVYSFRARYAARIPKDLVENRQEKSPRGLRQLLDLGDLGARGG
jgi:hypothetical protein